MPWMPCRMHHRYVAITRVVVQRLCAPLGCAGHADGRVTTGMRAMRADQLSRAGVSADGQKLGRHHGVAALPRRCCVRCGLVLSPSHPHSEPSLPRTPRTPFTPAPRHRASSWPLAPRCLVRPCVTILMSPLTRFVCGVGAMRYGLGAMRYGVGAMRYCRGRRD